MLLLVILPFWMTRSVTDASSGYNIPSQAGSDHKLPSFSDLGDQLFKETVGWKGFALSAGACWIGRQTIVKLCHSLLANGAFLFSHFVHFHIIENNKSKTLIYNATKNILVIQP